MSKFTIKMIMLGMLATFAVSAVATASASAAPPVWLNAKGEEPAANTPVLIDGLFIWVLEKIPPLEGGGKILVHCTGALHETIGPNGVDEITHVLGLMGEVDSKVDCEVIDSTNSICTASRLVFVTFLNLPWPTQLLGILGGNVEDMILKGTAMVSRTFECAGVSVKCEGEESAEFKGNGINGAIFKFTGVNKTACNIGEGKLEGEAEMLGGWDVS